jgi:hypothetical protein
LLAFLSTLFRGCKFLGGSEVSRIFVAEEAGVGSGQFDVLRPEVVASQHANLDYHKSLSVFTQH